MSFFFQVEEEFDEYGTTDLVDPSIFKGGDGFIVVGSLDLEVILRERKDFYYFYFIAVN